MTVSKLAIVALEDGYASLFTTKRAGSAVRDAVGSFVICNCFHWGAETGERGVNVPKNKAMRDHANAEIHCAF